MKDSQVLTISNASPEVVAAVEQFGLGLLSMGKGAADILAQADKHPESPLLQTYAACFWLYGQTEQAQLEAGRYLTGARKLEASANQREGQLLRAAQYWHERKYHQAALELEAAIARWPHDLVASKFLEYMYYLLGQHYSGPRFLKAFEKLYPENHENGYFLSSYSFALELCGRYEAALETAEKAIELEEQNPWAHHTLAHVYLKQGNLSDGTRTLERFRGVWSSSGQAIYSHNFWHLALMYLEKLDAPRAQTVLQDHILRDEPYLVIQELDAISLLWRLELAGFEVSREQWQNTADVVSANAGECHVAFNSAHYVYALARAQRPKECTNAIRMVREQALADAGPEKEVWKRTGLPLLEACSLFAMENYREAADLLIPIMEQIPTVGGSDAQDDLFRQTNLVCLIKAGAKSEAQNYLTQTFMCEKRTPLQEYWRSMI